MLILYWTLVLFMIVGVAGAVLPAVPGVGLIAVAIAIWGLVNGFAGLGVPLVVAIVALLISIGVDFLATYIGAKKAGASIWGQVGAVVGLLLGFFGLLPALPIGGPLLGILLGPLLGAIVGEFLYRRDWRLAVRAGFGILVGSLVGTVIHVMLAIATVAVFLATTLPTVM